MAGKNLFGRLLETLPPGCAGAIGAAFDRMKVAEEEIGDGLLEATTATERLRVWSAFGVLDPGPLVSFGLDLYRAHAREIVQRALLGADLRPATQAEVLGAISAMSLRSRLDRDVELLGLRLHDALFPDQPQLADGMDPTYPGATADAFRDLQRKLSRDDRTLTLKKPRPEIMKAAMRRAKEVRAS